MLPLKRRSFTSDYRGALAPLNALIPDPLKLADFDPGKDSSWYALREMFAPKLGYSIRSSSPMSIMPARCRPHHRRVAD
jgi:hypothetical protein